MIAAVPSRLWRRGRVSLCAPAVGECTAASAAEFRAERGCCFCRPLVEAVADRGRKGRNWCPLRHVAVVGLLPQTSDEECFGGGARRSQVWRLRGTHNLSAAGCGVELGPAPATAAANAALPGPFGISSSRGAPCKRRARHARRGAWRTVPDAQSDSDRESSITRRGTRACASP